MPDLSDARSSDEAREVPVRATRRRPRRLWPWLVIGLVLAVLGSYGAAYALAGNRLPGGTTIEGVDVGGLRPERAERLLADTLAARGDRPVHLRVAGRELALDPEELGLRLDVAASVDQVPVGRSWDPSDLWQTVTGGQDHEAVVVAEDGLLTKRLTQLSEEVGRPPVEGAVRFEPDRPLPTYPRTGTALDVPAAEEAVLTAFLSGDGPVDLELEMVPPQITAAEVDRALQEFAEPALSAPVTLVAAGESVTLPPEQYAGSLSMRAEGSRLVPSVDVSGTAQRAQALLRRASATPRDATVALVEGRPRVVPARDGVTVDEDGLAEALLRAVAAEGDDRTVTVPTVLDEPDLTTEEVRSWGVREVVSEFTTYYPHAEYRNVNIGRAAELIDGTLLAPGELFSFNETVGERTAANGFTRGFVISDGVFKEDYGGGVSQVATTTFNAAFFAGLEDVEHQPHSFYIDRYPVGREATVVWPVLDLKFRNDTEHGVLIETRHSPSTSATSGALTVRFWSTKLWDVESRTSERYDPTPPQTRVLTGEDCYPNEGYSGFDVDVTRVFRRAGSDEVEREEVMHTTYTPSDTVLCR